MHNLWLKVFYTGPYSGVSGTGVPINGAARLHSYLRQECESMYDPHIA